MISKLWRWWKHTHTHQKGYKLLNYDYKWWQQKMGIKTWGLEIKLNAYNRGTWTSLHQGSGLMMMATFLNGFRYEGIKAWINLLGGKKKFTMPTMYSFPLIESLRNVWGKKYSNHFCWLFFNLWKYTVTSAKKTKQCTLILLFTDKHLSLQESLIGSDRAC